MDFNVEKVTAECIEWIRSWFQAVNPGANAVVGISGGKDSTVAACLCAKALGRDHVIGVLMPNGIQNDINDSQKAVNFLGIRYLEINIKDGFAGLVNNILSAEIKNNCTADSFVKLSEQARVNMPPRVRMTVLYAVAQSLNGMVANTCNLSEDHVGYSTLYGDFSGSFSPLGRLTVSEVITMGKYLGLPQDLVEKAPSDGLCGKTDEDNLGFTYAELDRYLRTGEIENQDHKAAIDRRYRANKFKLDMLRLPTFDPGLEIRIEH